MWRRVERRTHDIVLGHVQQSLKRSLADIPPINDSDDLLDLVQLHQKVPREERILVRMPALGRIALAVRGSQVRDRVAVGPDLPAEVAPVLSFVGLGRRGEAVVEMGGGDGGFVVRWEVERVGKGVGREAEGGRVHDDHVGPGLLLRGKT